jgi:hypothetical protein
VIQFERTNSHLGLFLRFRQQERQRQRDDED